MNLDEVNLNIDFCESYNLRENYEPRNSRELP